MKGIFTFLAINFLATSALAAGSGRITGINFSGPNDNSHPNVVQFQIAGGFNSAGCDTQFAAIRVTDENAHLISFALAAYLSKEPVLPTLIPSDKYYADRCTVSRLSSVY